MCENVLVDGMLRMEGSLCCGLIDDRASSDVDVSVLKIGGTRKLATTTMAFICVCCVLEGEMMM